MFFARAVATVVNDGRAGLESSKGAYDLQSYPLRSTLEQSMRKAFRVVAPAIKGDPEVREGVQDGCGVWSTLRTEWS